MFEDKLELFKRHAEMCSICSNEKRLMIMESIGDGEKSVGDIADHLGMSSQAVSQHLRLMRDRGIVVSIRQGRQIFYEIANDKFLRAFRLVREGLIEEQEKLGKKLENL